MIYFVGLDPASPLFYKFYPAVKIDSQDVVFVDIIHTDGTREYYIYKSKKLCCLIKDHGLR